MRATRQRGRPSASPRRPRGSATAPGSEVPAFISPAGYARAVQRAGGRPVLLPPDPEDAEDPDGVLDLLDALDRHRRGRGPGPRPLRREAPPRDRTRAGGARRLRARAGTRRRYERAMPVLGICRGMQILNVAYGGGIEQHLPDVARPRGPPPHPGHLRRPRGRASSPAPSPPAPSARRGRRSSPTTTRGSGRSGPASLVTGRLPKTTRSRPSKTHPARSCSACSGTPRKTRRASS